MLASCPKQLSSAPVNRHADEEEGSAQPRAFFRVFRSALAPAQVFKSTVGTISIKVQFELCLGFRGFSVELDARLNPPRFEAFFLLYVRPTHRACIVPISRSFPE
jgi:hypothetical protein